MKSARLHPPLRRPLLPPKRLTVPDVLDEWDSPPVSSDDESEYYVSDEDDNNTDEVGYSRAGCPLVKEEIKDESEDCVDDNSTKGAGERSIGEVIIRWEDYDLDLKDDIPIWESYYRKAFENKGFDIKNYPGPRPLPAFYPIPYERKTFRMLKGYAESALKKYNDDKGTNHVVKDVEQAHGCGCREKFVDVKGGASREEVVNVKRGCCREKFLNVKGGGRCEKVVNPNGGGSRKKYLTVKPGGYLVKYLTVKPGGYLVKHTTVKRGDCRDYVYCLLFSAMTDDEKLIHFRAMVVKDQEDNLDFPVVRQVELIDERDWEGC